MATARGFGGTTHKLRFSRGALVLALVLLGGCARCGGPKLRGSPPVPPAGPGEAWVIREGFLSKTPWTRGAPLETTGFSVGYGDRVQVLVVDGDDAYVQIGPHRGHLPRAVLIEAEGVVEVTRCSDPPACREIYLAYDRDSEAVRVVFPSWREDPGPNAGLWASDVRFDDDLVAIARSGSRDLVQNAIATMVKREQAWLETQQKAAPAPVEAAAETASSPESPVEEGAAPAEGAEEAGEGGDADEGTRDGEADAAAMNRPCPEHSFEEHAPDRPTAEPGSLGIVVFDPEHNPVPGYDWRALAVAHLAGYKARAPLSPELRALAARQYHGEEFGEFVELGFAVPENVVRGYYYELSPDGFRSLPPSALRGSLHLRVDKGGCEIGERHYAGLVATRTGPFPAPVAWAPRPVSWKNESSVVIGDGGLRVEVGEVGTGEGVRAVLARKGHPPARSEPLACYEGHEPAAARIATLEPSGERILVALFGDRCFYAFHVKGTVLEELGAVVRGDL